MIFHCSLPTLQVGTAPAPYLIADVGDPARGFLRIVRTEACRQARLGAHAATELHEFIGAKTIVFLRPERKWRIAEHHPDQKPAPHPVRDPWPVGANPVRPMIRIRETPAWPAQQRRIQVLDRFQHIQTEPTAILWSLGPWFRYEASQYLPPHMLDILAIDAWIDRIQNDIRLDSYGASRIYHATSFLGQCGNRERFFGCCRAHSCCPKANVLLTRTVSVLFFGRNSRASGMRSAGRTSYLNPGICGGPYA